MRPVENASDSRVGRSGRASRTDPPNGRRPFWVRSLRLNWDLYLLLVPVVAYFVIFHYLPMYGVQIAFKDFIATKGITGSPWTGLKHFERFWDSAYFGRILWNTISINLYNLIVGFPAPIVLALMINEVASRWLKRWVQTITYAPYFLSTVVVVGMLFLFLDPKTGLIGAFIRAFGLDPVYFMIEEEWFKTIYVLSDVWQNIGWGSIVYLAALAGIDPQLHESAKMEGATRMQRIVYINLPSILPTIMILFILNMGAMLSIGFEKVYLMQNEMNLASSDIFATYVYRAGIQGAQYSFATAVNLFNSVINMILLIIFNRLSRKLTESSLW